MAANKIDMTAGSIFPKLLRFSLPLMLSSVLQLFFNAADIIVVGRFAGDNSLAAVGSTSSLINLLVNLFVGLSVGCNVVVANFIGANKKTEISKTVHTTVVLSFVSGVFLTVVGVIFSRLILLMMSVPEDVLPLSSIYLKIYFGGITATIVYNFGASLLRGMGDTKRPLFILLFAGVLNVFLNIFFVVSFKMDVAGVAWATVISQCFSAVCILIILFNEKDEFKLTVKNLRIEPSILKKVLKIGIPAGLQGTVFSFSNVVIQSAVNSFGAICVAGNSASQSIEGFIYTSMNAVSQASLTFVSQNMGAHKIDRVKKVTLVSLFSVSVVGILFCAVVLLFQNQLLSIYTANPGVVTAGKERLLIICSTYFTCGIMDVMANCIRGMGFSFLPMVVTLIGACGLRLLFLATVFQIPRFHTYQCIFLSYPMSWIITFFALAVIFLRLMSKQSR